MDTFIKPSWCGDSHHCQRNPFDWMENEMVSWRDSETGALVAAPECECKKHEKCNKAIDK